MNNTLFKTICLFLLMTTSSTIYASNAQMKDTLSQIVDALQAIKPLVEKAKNEQDANPRVKVQFDSFIDADGIKHNGLRQDIEQIQQGLIDIINQVPIEPRKLAPLKNDFVGDKNV